MNRFLAATGLFSMLLAAGADGQAQGIMDRPQGSRPDETYRVGQPAAQSEQQSESNQREDRQPELQGERRSGAAARTSAKSAGMPVIMEFSDLQCPDSARYNSGLKNQVMQRYVTSGRAAYEWHDFPLESHPQAPEAAAAARCAGSSADQVRQQIMANQGQMSENVYAGYARQAGVDADDFSACMRQQSKMREVQADRSLGQSLGVRGTPTLVLGISDGHGSARPVKVVKAYDPPQQVLAEIDSFLASAAAPGAQSVNSSAQQGAFTGQAAQPGIQQVQPGAHQQQGGYPAQPGSYPAPQPGGYPAPAQPYSR